MTTIIDLLGQVRTTGLEHITKVETALRNLLVAQDNYENRRALAYTLAKKDLRIASEQLATANARAAMTNQEVQAIAAKNVEVERMNAQNERRLMIEMEVVRLKNRGITGTYAHLQAIAAERVEMELNNVVLQQRRQMLFQTAFAIFAVTINIQFMMASLIRMAGADKEAAESLRQLQGAFTLAIGPIQLMLGLTQLMTIANAALRASIIGVMQTVSVVLPLIVALTTQSDNLRKIMLGVAAAFGVVNAILLAYRLKLIGVGLANIFVAQTEIIKKSVQTLGAAIPLIAGAIAGGLLLFEMLPKRGAQTQVGQGRLVEFHGGETAIVGRGGGPSAPFPLGGTGNMKVFLQIDSGPFFEAIVRRIERDNVSGVV